MKLIKSLNSVKIWAIYNLYDIFLSFRYNPPKKPQNDIALVRVKGDPIKFSRHVMPICLPPGPNFPDLKGVAYVAGYSNNNSEIFFKKVCKT